MESRRLLVFAVCGGLFAAPASLGAEDPPVPAPAAAPETAKLDPPAKAWREMQRERARGSSPAPGQIAKAAQEYLEAWAASKQTPADEDHHALGLLLGAAGRSAEARESFAASASCERLAPALRAASASAFATSVFTDAQQGELRGDALGAAVKRAEGWATVAEGPPAGSLRMALARLHGHVGSLDAALEDLALAAEAHPGLSIDAADAAVGLLVKGTIDLAVLPAHRAKLATLLGRIKPSMERGLDAARQAAEAATDPKQREQLANQLKRIEAETKRLATIGRPLEMLGTVVPEWTLVKAYGGGDGLADYRGKVVVLDFWATWCPWCIRSFPALRDLLKDYAGMDLAIVGVTASGGSVYDQRYDLDEDLKAKVTGEKPKPVLTRPKRPAPDAGVEPATYEAELAEYRAKEQEVIQTFITNHAMTWDVVQIDETEPGPKYALSGWPHCVVLDRAGRVRHFKSGALLRERPDAVAAFRKVLDGLLAEPTPGPTAAPAPAK